MISTPRIRRRPVSHDKAGAAETPQTAPPDASRDVGLKERVPMIGFPYHAAEIYFAKIVRKHDLYIIENERETQFIPSLLYIDNRLIDEDTGEILSEDEMREFDGDIYEPQGIDEPEPSVNQTIPKEVFALFGNKVEVR